MGEVTKTKTEDRSKTASFIRGIQKEYSKISWTSGEDVVKQTSAVIIVSCITGLIIAVLDACFSTVLNGLMGLVK